VSPATGKRYTVSMVCQVHGVARSTLYARKARAAGRGVGVAAKRGPKTLLSDDELVGLIREVIIDSPFHGEGHRKVRAQLAARTPAVPAHSR